jgi:chromosomal replication initiator protein
LETRLNILRAKADTMMTSELEGVLHIVAEKMCENVRQLEGALVYLTAQSKLSGAKITPETINKLLTTTTRKQDIKLLLQAVADHFDVAADELTGKRRDKKTALARHVAIYLMRERHNSSLAEIGKELGGRNHATVLHGYEKIANALGINPDLCNQISEIQEKLNYS